VNEKINAIVRFLTYAGIILSILKDDTVYILVALLLIILVTGLSALAKDENAKTSILLKQWFPEVTTALMRDCQQPTKNNPFANRILTDDIDRDPACPAEEVDDKVQMLLNESRPNDLTDPYGRNTGDRQFYSMPNTQITNDQEAFANWCWGNNDTCKSNHNTCTGSENSLNR
jgi:hypothetical protein